MLLKTLYPISSRHKINKKKEIFGIYCTGNRKPPEEVKYRFILK